MRLKVEKLSNNVNSLKLFYSNYYRNGGMVANTNDIIIRATVEVNGIRRPVFLNGNRDMLVPKGGIVTTDICDLFIKPSDAVYVYTYYSVGAGEYIPKVMTLTGVKYDGLDGLVVDVDYTDAGDIPITNGSNSEYAPSMVLALEVDEKSKTTLVVGDSIGSGTGDSSDFYYNNPGFINRPLYSNSVQFTNICVGGETAKCFFENITRSTPFTEGHDNVICQYGVNDIEGNITTSELKIILLNIWDYYSSKGMAVYQTTLTPSTSSSDYWKTLENQTTSIHNDVRLEINTWLREIAIGESNGSLEGVFDVASLVEIDSKWKEYELLASGYATAGATNSLTADELGSIENNLYNYTCMIEIIEGTGVGEQRAVTILKDGMAYVTPNWTTPPDNTSRYNVHLTATADGVHPASRAVDDLEVGIDIAKLE